MWKILVFVSILGICFTLVGAERLKIQTHQNWEVDTSFIVALRSNVIDDIFDGIDGNDKEFLDKLLRDGKIERVKKGDHIRVEKVYERKIGLEFAECTLYRKGRQEKRVWVFSAMISQLCSKVK
jgi:hypothetical protein